MLKAVTAWFTLVVPIALATAQEREPARPGDSLPKVSLGISVEDMPNDGRHGGVIIRQVMEGSAAEKSGLKKDDIIVRVSNRQVDDFDELVGAIAGHKPGDRLTFLIIRDEEPKRVKVTLGEPKQGGAVAAEGSEPACGYLGVLGLPSTDLTEETADRLGLSGDPGLVVLDVVPFSPAARAGLRHGDLLLRVNDEVIRDPEVLREKVYQIGAGKPVTLTFQRGEHKREVQVTLGAGPCDVRLIRSKTQGRGGDADPTIERLLRRIEQLEQRVQQLEAKRDK